MPIEIDAVESAIREMTKARRPINPLEICLYMGIEPFMILPHKEGEWVGKIDNVAIIYGHIRKLHEIHNKWQRRYREAYASYREGYLNASHWDVKLMKMIYYKDEMTYKEFIDMREPEEGLVRIPDPNNPDVYIEPNPQEIKNWRMKYISGGKKTLITRIEDGIDDGTIEDTRKTRKALDKFDPQKFLKYKEEEEYEEAQ